MNEEMKKELLALSKEMAERRDRAIAEWLETHEWPKLARGRIASKAQKELDQEEKRRYGEILAKYKDKIV